MTDREPIPADPPAPRPFGLKSDDWGRLVLIDAEGRRYVGVEPVRAFPISEPRRWVSLCDADGHEVAFVEDLEELPATTRQVLEGVLAAREFVPVIRRIVRASGDTTPADWDVETDRGPTRFTLNSEDDIRGLGPGRALIADTQGLRYLIPDIAALDPASRRVLDRFY